MYVRGGWDLWIREIRLGGGLMDGRMIVGSRVMGRGECAHDYSIMDLLVGPVGEASGIFMVQNAFKFSP